MSRSNSKAQSRHRRSLRLKAGAIVWIGQDCRPDEPVNTSMLATYEGRFWFHNGRRYRGPKEHLLAVGPRFVLEDGTSIWGIQCWWARCARARKA